jgi:mannosyl-oligosaccharide alpha-1,2-mannosidase
MPILLTMTLTRRFDTLVHILLASMAAIGCLVSCNCVILWLLNEANYLGGKLLNEDGIVETALQLVDACWNTYASTA